jgi:hypothetical protein
MNGIGIVRISIVDRIIDVESRDHAHNISPINYIVVLKVHLLRERCRRESQNK